MSLPRRLPLIVALLLASGSAAAITVGQVDDFEDGDVAGWIEGDPSPNPPVVILDGGPGGAGDAYLSNTSQFPPGGGGSRQVMYNQAQWAGNYAAAGVTSIEADVANFSDSERLYVRIAIGDNDAPLIGGNWFVSTVAFEIDPADGWQHVTFGLDAASLTQVEGTATLDEVLASVVTLRILSAEFLDAKGDQLAGTLGVDNITAVGVIPVPAAGWLLLSGVLGLVGMRRARKT